MLCVAAAVAEIFSCAIATAAVDRTVVKIPIFVPVFFTF
jgi:hypothetical protein